MAIHPGKSPSRGLLGVLLLLAGLIVLGLSRQAGLF